MLHTVKHSPLSHFHLAQCLRYMDAGDQLLLWQDAVIAVTLPDWQQQLASLAERGDLYVMRDDLVARGLEGQLGTPVSMEDLVSLIVEKGSPQAW
ncbi:sulfurtransferase complex subunit TusB [Zobellella maritima]|uniref:sulfurtransferase complex subunit TusB n=1 Tax=Zobellella maritima TaxID=2059725 RepID=UPI000E300342|nr:sulfurtransferase complex subunit TusB [Zobellella maritima]